MTERFRKKPVVIEAVQYRAGETLDSAFVGDDYSLLRYTEEGTVLIQTLEGVMSAQPGDWIIRGVSGELSPRKPNIFAATYEPVSTTQHPAPWGYGCPLHPGDPSGMSGTPGRCNARPASGAKGRTSVQVCGEVLVPLFVGAPQTGEPVASCEMNGATCLGHSHDPIQMRWMHKHRVEFPVIDLYAAPAEGRHCEACSIYGHLDPDVITNCPGIGGRP